MTSPTSPEEPEQLTVVDEEPQPGVLVVRLMGWLDLATAPGAEARLQELLDTRTLPPGGMFLPLQSS